jgi:hypothetical protein
VGRRATLYLEPVATLDVDILISLQGQPRSSLSSPELVFKYVTGRWARMEGEYLIIADWPAEFAFRSFCAARARDVHVIDRGGLRPLGKKEVANQSFLPRFIEKQHFGVKAHFSARIQRQVFHELAPHGDFHPIAARSRGMVVKASPLNALTIEQF